jgi:hypothetical protein
LTSATGGRAPLLTLDRDGVTLHSARIRLPWSNVAEIRIGHTAARRWSAASVCHHHSLGRNPVKISR